MNARTRIAIAAYAGVVLSIALLNLTSTSTARKVHSPAMTGSNIPEAYVATLPAVEKNGGVAPAHVNAAKVVPYVLESHRGWPWHFEDKYGYRYDLSNGAAGYSTTLVGYPDGSRIKLSHLVMNFVGPLAVIAILHLSIIMFFANFRVAKPLRLRPQAG